MASNWFPRIWAAGGDHPPAARIYFAIGFVGFALLWRFSEPVEPFGDFHRAYFDAAKRVWHSGAVATWPSEGSCVEGFVNIPILAWLFVPMLAFGERVSAWVFLAASLAGLTWTWWKLAQSSRSGVALGPLLAMMFLINGPLVYSLREGNLTSLVLALLVLLLVLWLQGREVATGVVLGITVVFKPPLLLFGVYFVVRRLWRIVGAASAVIAGVLALSLVVFGVAVNVGWYDDCIAPFVGHVIPAFNVQSIDAFLARLASGNLYLVDWSTHEFTSVHRLVRPAILGLLFSVVAWPIVRRCRREWGSTPPAAAGKDDVLEFSMLLLLAVVTSPISWTHYYAFLLLPLALYLAGVLELRSGRLVKRLLIGGYVLSALPVLFPSQAEPMAVSDLVARTAVSAWLLGGLVMLAALVHVAWVRSGIVSDRWASTDIEDRRAAIPLLPLLAVLVACGVGVSFVVWLLAPVPFREATLDHTLAVLGGQMADDSWAPMWTALTYFEREYFDPRYTAPIYSEVFFNRHIKFQYPPTSLFAMAWMRDLDNSIDDWPSLLAVVSLEFLVATACAVAVLAHLRLRLHLPSGRVVHPAATGALAFLATLSFYPQVKSLSLGQIQTWSNALIAVALVAWVLGHRVATGVLVGLACLLKPQYALVLVWAALRREWRFLAAGGLVLFAALSLSLHVFGLANHLDYLRVLSFLSERGEGFYANQSMNGLLNRVMSFVDPTAFDNLLWRESQFPPRHAFVYTGTMLTSAAIVLAALLRPRLEGDEDGALDLARITLSATLASPIAWEHHYGVLLPMFVLALAASAEDGARLWWLAVSFVLAGNLLISANTLAATPVSFIQSYLFAAALIILVILHRAPSRVARADGAPGGRTSREAAPGG